MPVTARPGLVLAVVAACAWTTRRDAAPVPAHGPLTFHQNIAPFPVTDSTGRLLEMAFLGGFNTPRPQLVDADGDGDLDLFVQEVNSKISYFERDGVKDGLPHFIYRTDKYGDIDAGQWYRFADVDRDGDLDLLTEQPFSYIKYYRNDGGKGKALHFTLAADTLRDPNGKPLFADAQNIPQLGDLDCNGRADLLIGRVDGTVSRYEATEESSKSPNGVPVFQKVVDEFEGIKIIGQGNIGGAIPGPPPIPSPSKSSQPTPGQNGPSVPLDASGDAPNTVKHGANTMALADIDGKGVQDLFWGDYFEPGLLRIPNSGTCQAPNFKNKPVPFPQPDPIKTSGYNAPSFGDVNGDNRTDLVMGVLGGAYNPLLTSVDNLYYVERTADGGWNVLSRHLLPVLDIGSESIPTAVDIDGDGDLDLLLANKIEPTALTTSRIFIYENVGTKTKPELKQHGFLKVPGRDRFHYAPAFGDLDGDGKLDVIMGQWGPSLAWYHYANGQLVEVDTAIATIPRGSNTTPALGDLDGDGDLDLLVGEASGYINYFENVGSKKQPKFKLVSEEYQEIKIGRRATPHLVDIDGDGKLDLLVGSESEGVALFRNTGTKKAPKFVQDTTFKLPVPAMSAPTTGDFNGDGKLDLVVGNAGGGAVYFEQQ